MTGYIKGQRGRTGSFETDRNTTGFFKMQISTWLWNWLESRQQRRPPVTPLDHVARLSLRKLEERQVLSVSAVFNAGVLDVSIDNTDSTHSVTVSVDNGDVLINGQIVDVGGGAHLHAADVTGLHVTDTANTDNAIDLHGVDAAHFTSLTSLTVDAGGGNDTITAAMFAETLNGGAGNDTYVFLDGFGATTVIDQAGDTNTLNFSAVTTDVLANLNTGTITVGASTVAFDATQISTLIGHVGGADSLTGSNNASSWTLDASNTYTDGTVTISFAGFETLHGGTGTDTFDVNLANGNLTIDGGAGSDTINVNHSLTLTGTDSLSFAAETISVGSFTISSVDGNQTYTGNLQLDGSTLSTTGNGTIQLGGDLSITGTSASTIEGHLVLIGSDHIFTVANVTSDSANDLIVNSTVDGSFALTLNGPGSTLFSGAIGGITKLSSISQNNGAVQFNENVNVSGGATFNSNVTLDGMTFTAGGPVTFGDAAADSLSITTAAATITTTSGNVTLNAKTTGNQNFAVNSAGGITVNGSIDPTTVTLTSNDDITINAAVVATDLITISAGQDGTGSILLANTGSLSVDNVGNTADITMTTGATSGNVTLNGSTSADHTVTITTVENINGAGTITAATVDLNAGTGIGDLAALNLVASTISADTTGGNVDLANASAATSTSLTTGTGSITVVNTGSATFTTATTTSGQIDLTDRVIKEIAKRSGSGAR